MTQVLLFDIDGTLVLTGGAGMRAMNRACEDLVRGDDAMAGVTFAGRTEPHGHLDPVRCGGRARCRV